MAGHASDPLPLGAAAWWRWGLFCVLLLAFILVPFYFLEGVMSALVQQTLRSEASIAWITLAVVLFLLADI
ncbi:MAG: hypothetical protein OEY03_14650, partial [Rhizobacter sp.]|nr:hypothetical protein [Rhizobacter sp.]